MTCILAANGAIAADRRRSGPHLCSVNKTWAAPDGSIFADAGDASWGERFREWYCAGQKADQRDTIAKLMHDMGGDMLAIQVRLDGVIVLWENPFLPLPMDTKTYGIGSGSPYALGAFSAGASMQDAIRIASQWDEYTSPESDILTLAQVAPKRKRKR